MNIADLNGSLAVFGGISGVLLISYMVWVAYWTRRRSLDVYRLERRVLERLGRIEGLLLSRRR